MSTSLKDEQPNAPPEVSIDSSVKTNKVKKSRKKWSPLFYPKEYWKELEDRHLSSHTFKKVALRALAKDMISKRKFFLDEAEDAFQQKADQVMDCFKSACKLARKLQARGYGVKEKKPTLSVAECKEPASVDSRRRGKNRPKLSVKEKIEIIYKVICKELPEKDVAKEFRVSANYVSKLITKIRRRPRFLRELAEAEDELAIERKQAREAITQYLKEDAVLSSVDDIKVRLQNDHKIDIKSPKLLRIMHEDLNLRYKRIKAISWQGNAPKSIILCKQFAVNFLNLDLNK